MPTDAPASSDTATASISSERLRLTLDDGVATFWIDEPDASVNTISPATLDAFESAVERLETDDAIEAAIFISGKAETFIAGADLKALQAFEMPADARQLSHRAHRIIQRVQRCDVPTVAAINGPALGGGLEMALACTARIATTHDATRLALPEVKLGLLPGGGGTQTLPRLVGLQQALTMMLTGKNIYPEKAERIGLVDTLIHPPGLHRAAVQLARDLAGGAAPDQDDRSFTDRLLESNTISRRLVYRQAAERTRKKTSGNYPAPPKIIDCVRTGLEQGLEAGLEAEATAFGELAFTPESKALVSLFFAKQEGETNDHADRARSVHTIGVLGAGLMGAGIASVSAENGLDVVLKDQELSLAAEGKRHVWKTIKKKADKGILSDFEHDMITERVMPTADYGPLRHADLVIEAVPEDLELKQQVLADVEDTVADDCVIASNTSSLPISDIAAEADRPERVLGMHYFSPVSQMPLVEIIRTPETSEAALATAVDVGLQQGKTVIVVGDGPGFYTTRILAVFMNEALLLLEEGADAEAIDTCMEDFGFPMGPYELFDLVGIEVAAKITDVMSDYLDAERLSISSAAETLVENNLLGQKNGRGFYLYEEDDAGDQEKQRFNEAVYRHFGGEPRTTPAAETVQRRLTLLMVNEAARCLEDDILQTPVDGDLGAVFGLGFPPFRGGPFRYVDQVGADVIVRRLQQLADTHGARFAPATILQSHATAGTTFHGDA